MPTFNSPTPWFLGTMLVDPGEEGFDGAIWAPPLESGDEPYRVCDRIHEEDARFVVHAVNAHADLLFGCEGALGLLLVRLDMAEITDDEKRHIECLRLILARM